MKKIDPKILLTTIITMSMLWFACTENQPKEVVGGSDSTQGVLDESLEQKSKKIKQVFYSLPSPLELTLLFKKEGAEYHEERLNSVRNVDQYVTSNDKALNLGIYGADLSYAGLFGKNQDAINYLNVSNKLANDLGISESFEQEFVARLERNARDRDTLLQVITDFFLDNDSYLKSHKRQYVSSLIIIGGWIEGLYLGSNMVSENQENSGMRNIIAQQAYSMENLMKLVRGEEMDENLGELMGQLEKLESLYQEVEITESNDSNTANGSNNKMVLGGKKTYVMSDSLFQSIKLTVEEIRTSITE